MISSLKLQKSAKRVPFSFTSQRSYVPLCFSSARCPSLPWHSYLPCLSGCHSLESSELALAIVCRTSPSLWVCRCIPLDDGDVSALKYKSSCDDPIRHWFPFKEASCCVFTEEQAHTSHMWILFILLPRVQKPLSSPLPQRCSIYINELLLHWCCIFSFPWKVVLAFLREAEFTHSSILVLSGLELQQAFPPLGSPRALAQGFHPSPTGRGACFIQVGFFSSGFGFSNRLVFGRVGDWPKQSMELAC